MIDPVTALATASTAFNLIKKGFAAGRDIEAMGSDLGRWMGAVSDIKKCEEYSKRHHYLKNYLLLVPWKKKHYKHLWLRKKQKICANSSNLLLCFHGVWEHGKNY